MHSKYEVSTSNGSKVIANVKVDNRQTNKQTDRHTNKQTNTQTDRTKQYAPDHSIRGHKNTVMYHFDYKAVAWGGKVWSA